MQTYLCALVLTFKLGVTVEEIPAGPGRVVLGADGLLHAFELLPHRVDVCIHVHQLGVEVIRCLTLALFLAADVRGVESDESG